MIDSELVHLPLERITLSQTEAQKARRGRFDPESLQELADSIATHGVLQPIIARATSTDYELVAGERRYLASKLAQKADIPTIVRALSDRAVIEVQLIEKILDRAFTGFVALPQPEQWFQVLGVSSKASPAEIEAAYRKLAMQHHPDRGGDASQMSRINTARDAGLDPS